MLSFVTKFSAAVALLGALWALNSVQKTPIRNGQVRILRFYASVGVVLTGESAELCYGVENARSVRMSPPIAGLYPSSRRCLQVVPEHTTHYTILAEGYDGKIAMQSLTLPVQTTPDAPPPAVNYAVAAFPRFRSFQPLISWTTPCTWANVASARRNCDELNQIEFFISRVNRSRLAAGRQYIAVPTGPRGVGYMKQLDPESWPALSRLLDQWLDLPEEARDNWLESLGQEYAGILPTLRNVIASQAAPEAEGFLGTLPALGPSHAATELAPGILIGPYRLIGELGHGGMGVVWLAERADGQVKRRVALKLPLVSLYNRTLVDRFDRERDILAQLNHPHIARLYDAGITERGQPYLALEFVEGEQITHYADQRELALKVRLQLFLQVLGAAQYAHTNLIVHRDLKPANILVTNQGDVRLLDFGIAKLLTEGVADETELTRLGGRALTPDYASPEQIAGDTITTASDVYSLGVVLYELVTGSRPYKRKRNTPAGLEDAILGTEPVRPSQADENAAAAQARGLTPKRLARSLKGDLDTILLKALSKQPGQRYASADAFAQDIERHLNGDPVLARPESAWYRAGKRILRNKLAVAALAAVIIALSAGLSVALWEAHIAQVQTRTAETVRAFLLDIFHANSTANPDPVRARQTTARELLDTGAKTIDNALNDAPEAKLNVLETLFGLYVDLGVQDQAVLLGRRRVAIAKSIYGPAHPEVARALVDLAVNSGESSHSADRQVLLDEAGKILDRNHDSRSRTRAMYYVAMGGAVFGSSAASSSNYAAKAIDIYRQYPPSRELVSALNLLGQSQDLQDRYPEVIVSLTEASKIANSLAGQARRPLPAIYAVLGNAQRHEHDFSGAEKSLRLAVQTARAIQGGESSALLQTEWRLGVFLAQTARPQEGLQVMKEAVDLAVRTQGSEEAFHTPMVRRAYGGHLVRYGRLEEGLVPLTQAMDVQRRAKLSGRTDFATTMEWDAMGEIGLGHVARAQALLDEASAIRRGAPVQAPEELSYTLLPYIQLMTATGRAEEAARSLQDSGIEPNTKGKLTYTWLNMTTVRADVELARNRPDFAIQKAREVQRRIQESGVGPYFKRWDAQAALAEGKGLLAAGRAVEALPVLRRAVLLGSEVYDPDLSPDLADSQVALSSCLLALRQGDEARTVAEQAKKIHARYRDLSEQFRKPMRELQARLSQRK